MYIRYVFVAIFNACRFQMMQEICEIACYSGYSPDYSNVSIASHGNTVVMITLLPCQHCYCDPVLFVYHIRQIFRRGKVLWLLHFFTQLRIVY